MKPSQNLASRHGRINPVEDRLPHSAVPGTVRFNPPPAEGAVQPTNGQKNNGKIEVSKGERWFDWLTYGGIAGVGTFLLSLPLGYWARYSKGGQAALHHTAEALSKVGISAHAAEDVVMTTSLMQGGNILIPIVKAAEDKKPEMVAKLNKRLGDASGACSVEDEPKQSWGSLIASRLAAWTAVFVSLRTAAHVIGKEAFEKFENRFSESVVCKPLGQPTHVLGKETTLFRVGKIAAIDVFATAAATVLLYAGSRMMAGLGGEKWHVKQKDGSVAAVAAENAALCEVPEAPAEAKKSSHSSRLSSPATSWQAQAATSTSPEAPQLGM